MIQRRKVPRERREEQILDSATRLFGERGYPGTSMEEVARDVGVTKPMIYVYFGSKQGLFVACAGRAWRGAGDAIWAAATAAGPPDERMWLAALAYFDFVERNRDLWRVIYPDPSNVDEQASAQLAGARRGALDMMAALFTASAGEEHVDPGLADLAAPLAHAFHGAATAIAGWWLDHPDEPKELQATRLMNFAWMGFGDLMAGRMWSPPPHDRAQLPGITRPDS